MWLRRYCTAKQVDCFTRRPCQETPESGRRSYWGGAGVGGGARVGGKVGWNGCGCKWLWGNVLGAGPLVSCGKGTYDARVSVYSGGDPSCWVRNGGERSLRRGDRFSGGVCAEWGSG